MKKHFWLVSLLLLALPLSHARADLGFWSAALVGTWRHPSNGDSYQFNSNATYVFRAGAAKRSAGNISHEGFWKVVQPTEKESGGSMEGPIALSLRSTSRVVLEGKKSRVLKSNRRFRFVADVAQSAKTDERFVDRQHYWLGGVKWRRVR